MDFSKPMSWCRICGNYFSNNMTIKQHDLACHYDYVLAQHGMDKELVKKWVSEND